MMSCVIAAIVCITVTCALGLFKDIFKDLSGETMLLKPDRLVHK